MKTTLIILAILTGLMMLFTVICGLWMHAQEEIDPSSVNFHLGMALVTVLLTAITLVLAVKQAA
jgi:hypothetical protein